MKSRVIRQLVASVLGCFAVAANAAVIDFEADTNGGKANGFTSAGHPLVVFSDTNGNNLNITNYGGQGNGTRSLGVHSDGDGSKLRMDFGVSLTAISLAFGNDDPGWTNPSDRAWLEVFNGGISVGLVSAVMNRNDLMDQTIAYSGTGFNRAEFWYGDGVGAPYTHNGNTTGLTEVVDQINYTPGVPDAGSTLTLAVLGLLGLAAARRRQLA